MKIRIFVKHYKYKIIQFWDINLGDLTEYNSNFHSCYNNMRRVEDSYLHLDKYSFSKQLGGNYNYCKHVYGVTKEIFHCSNLVVYCSNKSRLSLVFSVFLSNI